MLYMNVLLRATVRDNLSEKRRGGGIHWCFELSVGYLSTSIPSAPRSPSPTYCMWLSTSIWNHQDQSKPDYCNWQLKGQLQSALGSVVGERLKNPEKQGVSSFIKASLIKKNFKKMCTPHITVSKQWRSHCLIYWNFLFCPWGEISRCPLVWSWALEVCSWSSALPG